MSLSVAQVHAYVLANTLMLPVLLIRGDEGSVTASFSGTAGRPVSSTSP